MLILKLPPDRELEFYTKSYILGAACEPPLKGSQIALSTQLYPESPFAMMPHTSPELAEQVAIALIKMPPDTPAAIAGKYHGWSIPANYQPVHEILRHLQVRPYEDWGKVTWREAIYQYRYWLGFVGFSIFSFTYGAVYLIQQMTENYAQRLSNYSTDL